MSRDNLGSKQKIVLHKCLIKNERYDLVITPHRQTIGKIRSKRQTQLLTQLCKNRKTLAEYVVNPYEEGS